MIQLLPNKGVVTIYMHPYIGVANSEKRTRIREYIGFDSVTSDKESYGISYAQYYYERIEWNIAKRDDVGAYMYTGTFNMTAGEITKNRVGYCINRHNEANIKILNRHLRVGYG